ncbi:MAG TPA: hypothetical protein VID50_03685 [Candidatus Eisenbacteria bacterium]|jgi:hypothetical protein
MNAAPPVFVTRQPILPASPRRGTSYLREYRTQPRRAPRPRVFLLLLLLAGLLFLRVWERTQANALAMQRDRLARDVHALANRIQLSTELADQAALREGLSLGALTSRGFGSPDPARVVEIDRALTAAPAPPAAQGYGGALSRLIRRILPERTRGNGAEMPPATEAGVSR